MIGVLVVLSWGAGAKMLRSVSTWVVPYFLGVTWIYSQLNDWPVEQSFFYAVDTGCSIGFGAFEETNDMSRAFTIVHIILTDSLIVFGAFQYFLDLTMKKSNISDRALRQFYRQMTQTSERDDSRQSETKPPLSIFLLLLYFFIGTQWGVYRHGWSVLNSLYFSVSALSSVGLETPQTTKETGFLREDDAIFVGLFCLSGVPIMGIAMQSIASYVFTPQELKIKSHYKTSKIEHSEYSDAAKILELGHESNVGLSEFVVLEMLRLKKIDTTMLGELKRLFRRIDADHDGTLTLENLKNWGMLRNQKSTTNSSKQNTTSSIKRRRNKTPTRRRRSKRRNSS